jgi:serine/threonine protein kinase
VPEQHGNITISPMTDPMLGQVIRGYVIRNKLAEGGMGAVYVATHERLETRKVVKILLPIYARHPMLRDRFEREALAVSRLRHKHIVTIDDYGQLPDGQLFLMMPFLEGRPLDVYLAEHRQFTEHRTLHIIVQVCSALQHMHDARIVHRDIKPSNIFIVKDDDNPYRVVLLDLGIAKSLSERDLVTHAGASVHGGGAARGRGQRHPSCGRVRRRGRCLGDGSRSNALGNPHDLVRGALHAEEAGASSSSIMDVGGMVRDPGQRPLCPPQ